MKGANRAKRSASRSEGSAAASSSGIIIGRVQKLLYGRQPIPENVLDMVQIADEVKRFIAAIEAARETIDVERKHLLGTSSNDPQLILDMHRMLITDPELIKKVTERINTEQINAEWALRQELDIIQRTFAQMDDEYLRNRKSDIEQAGRRILQHLTNSQSEQTDPRHQKQTLSDPVIYVGDEFSVSDVVSMWRHRVAGIITEQGGADAHNIIVARGIGLPALVGATGILTDIEDGDTLIMDAEQGVWILNPTPAEKASYAQFIEEFYLAQLELQAYAKRPSLSSDGKELKLMANIEFPEELQIAEKIGINGIGLLRSEFLFLNEKVVPDEQAQFEHYVSLVRQMNGNPITVRLLDVGGDKSWLYKSMTGHHYGGANPSMGLRGIRLLLRSPELLNQQLSALIRAGEEGPVHILVPMVTSVEEIKAVRRFAEILHRQLEAKQLLSIGTMIEVPAAVFIADELAKVSDFFSIGTNDLMQYTLASDRSDDDVASLYQNSHPAIFQLIKKAAKAAKKAGIPISVCGELAANPDWTETFLNMDMESLSMSLSKLLFIRRHLSEQRYTPFF